MNLAPKPVSRNLTTTLRFLLGLLIFLACLWVVRSQRAYMNTRANRFQTEWQRADIPFTNLYTTPEK